MPAVLYFVGALVTALAPDFVIMVIGRFVFGIGIGLVICSMHDHLFILIHVMNILELIIMYMCCSALMVHCLCIQLKFYRASYISADAHTHLTCSLSS